MKFSEFSNVVLDLTDRPSITLIKELRAGDVIVYEGEEYTVVDRATKLHKNAWLLSVRNAQGVRVIKLVQNDREPMTNHEKNQMINNIKSIVAEYDDERLVELIPRYLHNLNTINKYQESDVRECMSHFPADLLKRAGIVL